MKCKFLRIISMALVIATIFTLIMSVSAAFGPANRKSTSTIAIVTCGDKLFGKTSTFTVKNTDSEAIIFSAPTSISGCKWSRGVGFPHFQNTATVYPGGYAKFVLKTSFGKVGQAEFQIRSAYKGRKYSASITGTNYHCMAVVG